MAYTSDQTVPQLMSCLQPLHQFCLQARQQLQEAEGGSAQLRQQLTQAQHSGRGNEALAEKLRERLADRIQAEDRRARRDAEAYARLQRAMSVAKGTC